MAICSNCQAMIEAYTALREQLDSALTNVPAPTAKAGNLSSAIMPEIIINGKTIDDGEFGRISAKLPEVSQLLSAMISECNEKIAEYSNCPHVIEYPEDDNTIAGTYYR